MPTSSEEPFRAQFGEDRLLAAYFGGRQDGYYVEVGAHDGVHLSNTFYFEQIGWTGILVEPDPELARACARQRPNSTVVQCAAVAPGSPPMVPFAVAVDARDHSSLSLDELHQTKLKGLTGAVNVDRIAVPARTLDSILSDFGPARIDLVSIDVEGHEWEVLQGFSISRWRPGMIILERNRALPDPRIMACMRRHDYLYCRTTGVNDWFRAGPPGSARRLSYRVRVLQAFYLPLYASAAKARAYQTLRPVLASLGLSKVVRAMIRR